MNVPGPSAPFPRVSTAASGLRLPSEPAAATTPERAEAGPTLWDLLTPEERAFFSQQQAHGPLTYRPAGAVRAPEPGVLPIGQRVDVKG